MKRLHQRRLGVLLVSVAAGFGAWIYAPGTDLDRLAFTTVARGFATAPFGVTGKGSEESPWRLRPLSSPPKPAGTRAPVVVSIGDDREGFFQKSPPAPIDMALVFKNLKRMGKTKVASAAVLAWEAPDPIGLAALEKSLAGFESVVMTSPLSRGAIASMMPPTFRRASIPLTAIHGNTSALPGVNRVSIPSVVLVGDKTLAGFSVLEAEPSAEYYPLVARWEDRAVFAFPLLAALQQRNLPIEGVEVRLGKYLKLGAAGPWVKIDRYGRMALPPEKIPAQVEIPAESVIGGGTDLFPNPQQEPVVVRDDQSAAEAATREFSRNLTSIVTAITSKDKRGGADEYPRLESTWEIAVISFIVIAVTFLSGYSWRHFGYLLLIGICLSEQWIALGIANIWLPGLSEIAAIGAACVVSLVLKDKITSSMTPIGEPLPKQHWRSLCEPADES